MAVIFGTYLTSTM